MIEEQNREKSLSKEDIKLFISYSAFVLSGAAAGALGASGLGVIGTALLTGVATFAGISVLDHFDEKSK